ncbi:MAG: hypothetical protein GVY12_13180 [Bacteroidetes bacterium]|jgi:hypothetical protein|nr:hypothetical protein [Bacteroidota bacterium]
MPSTTYPLRTTVRCTAKEHAAIERKAKAAGLSKSRYLARVGSADDPPDFSDPSAQIERLETFVRELRRQGENLSEIARVARATGIRHDEVASASETIERCAVSLTRLIESLYTGESSLTADGLEIFRHFSHRIVPSPLWRKCSPAELEWVRVTGILNKMVVDNYLLYEEAQRIFKLYTRPSARGVNERFPGFM